MTKICLSLFFILFTSFAFAAEGAKEVEITSNIANKHIPQGATYPVRVSIKNNSQNIIIPLGFWAEYAGGENIEGSQHVWNKPLYGMLTFSEPENTYHLNQTIQLESFARLQTRLLLPKEALAFEKEMRFLKTGRVDVSLGLLYLKGDTENISKAIYIAHDTSKPANIAYKNPGVDEVLSWQKQKPPFEINFILREPALLKSETVTSPAAIEIDPLTLSLEDAFRKAGFRTSIYTFSFWKNAWVFEKNKNLYIVDVQGIKTYPKIGIDIFKYIESSDLVIYFIIYDAKAFEKIRHMFLGYNIKEEKPVIIRAPKGAALDICEYLNNVKFEVSLSQFGLTPAIEITEVKR